MLGKVCLRTRENMAKIPRVGFFFWCQLSWNTWLVVLPVVWCQHVPQNLQSVCCSYGNDTKHKILVLSCNRRQETAAKEVSSNNAFRNSALLRKFGYFGGIPGPLMKVYRGPFIKMNRLYIISLLVGGGYPQWILHDRLQVLYPVSTGCFQIHIQRASVKRCKIKTSQCTTAWSGCRIPGTVREKVYNRLGSRVNLRGILGFQRHLERESWGIGKIASTPFSTLTFVARPSATAKGALLFTIKN